MRAYCWLASLPPFTQPYQHLPMVVHRVLCASWSPACGIAALIGVLDRCSVSAKISRLSILLPSCSHLCLSFTARPLPTFSASLVRALPASKGACVKKNSNNNQPAGAKGMSPFCFFAVDAFWSSHSLVLLSSFSSSRTMATVAGHLRGSRFMTTGDTTINKGGEGGKMVSFVVAVSVFRNQI